MPHDESSDGLNPVQEKNGATVTANLLTGLGIDEFFQRTDGVGSRGLLTDALGSTVALGDSTGTLQTQYTYEPFGYVSQTGQANSSSYKYTGREDDGSGSPIIGPDTITQGCNDSLRKIRLGLPEEISIFTGMCETTKHGWLTRRVSDQATRSIVRKTR